MKALETGDGEVVWRHLQDISDAEYQQVTFEVYQSID